MTGFLWKADPDKQQQFLDKYQRQKAPPGRPGRGARAATSWMPCHPIWGLDLVFSCWLLVGQRFLAGMGGGRKRLNILGAYCPDDHEYLDLRSDAGQHQRRAVRQPAATLCESASRRPSGSSSTWTTRGTTPSPVVKEWLQRHPEFHLEPLPPYSPNLNLIERLWKFLRKKALSRWHKTFEAMQAAVSEVLDHLSDYRSELDTLMTETFTSWRRKRFRWSIGRSPERGEGRYRRRGQVSSHGRLAAVVCSSGPPNIPPMGAESMARHRAWPQQRRGGSGTATV